MAAEAIAAEIEDFPEDEENVPSELDEATHREMLHLYRESADTVRFAKSQQWKTLGATMLLFAGFIVLGKAEGLNLTLAKTLTFSSFVVSASALYMLTLFQFWQNTEREKIRTLSKHLSSLAQSIRRLKSRREANVHRYTILFFMVATICLGNALVVMVLKPLYT